MAKVDLEEYEYELSDVEIRQLKEHNQRRIKRMVALVSILMTLLSLALVAFSLALGRKIDLMVEESMEKRLASEYFHSNINITESMTP